MLCGPPVMTSTSYAATTLYTPAAGGSCLHSSGTSNTRCCPEPLTVACTDTTPAPAAACPKRCCCCCTGNQAPVPAAPPAAAAAVPSGATQVCSCICRGCKLCSGSVDPSLDVSSRAISGRNAAAAAGPTWPAPLLLTCSTAHSCPVSCAGCCCGWSSSAGSCCSSSCSGCCVDLPCRACSTSAAVTRHALPLLAGAPAAAAAGSCTSSTWRMPSAKGPGCTLTLSSTGRVAASSWPAAATGRTWYTCSPTHASPTPSGSTTSAVPCSRENSEAVPSAACQSGCSCSPCCCCCCCCWSSRQLRRRSSSSLPGVSAAISCAAPSNSCSRRCTVHPSTS